MVYELMSLLFALAQGGAMNLTSTAFAASGGIPTKYTCESQSEVSPPLAWNDVPPQAKSLALIVEDPDAPDPKAPQRIWVHWVVVNLPPGPGKLDEGGPLPAGARAGLNDWKKPAWGGPCPPIGRHRYFFRLYALDTKIDLQQPTKAELESAMKGHILATAELMGTYEKTKK